MASCSVCATQKGSIRPAGDGRGSEKHTSIALTSLHLNALIAVNSRDEMEGDKATNYIDTITNMLAIYEDE